MYYKVAGTLQDTAQKTTLIIAADSPEHALELATSRGITVDEITPVESSETPLPPEPHLRTPPSQETRVYQNLQTTSGLLKVLAVLGMAFGTIGFVIGLIMGSLKDRSAPTLLSSSLSLFVSTLLVFFAADIPMALGILVRNSEKKRR